MIILQIDADVTQATGDSTIAVVKGMLQLSRSTLQSLQLKRVHR